MTCYATHVVYIIRKPIISYVYGVRCDVLCTVYGARHNTKKIIALFFCMHRADHIFLQVIDRDIDAGSANRAITILTL